jgi:hypothetical protein
MDHQRNIELSTDELDGVSGGRGVVATISQAITTAENVIIGLVNAGLGDLTSLSDDLDRVNGTSLDKGVELDTLVKMPAPERQLGTHPSARPIRRQVARPGPERPSPGDYNQKHDPARHVPCLHLTIKRALERASR